MPLLNIFTLYQFLCNMGSNDVYDFDTGADKDKKESVVNIVGRNIHCCLLVTCSWFLGSYLYICGGCESKCYITISFCNHLWLYIPVPTISVKLPRSGGTLMLCCIWSFCYDCLLLASKQHQVVLLLIPIQWRRLRVTESGLICISVSSQSHIQFFQHQHLLVSQHHLSCSAVISTR